MTLKQEWKVAQWLEKNGNTKISDAPKHIRANCRDPKKFYLIQTAHRDSNGYPVMTDDDVLVLTDKHRDLIAEETVRRKRLKFEQETVVIARIALVLSALSIAWQIYTWTEAREELTGAPAEASIYTHQAGE